MPAHGTATGSDLRANRNRLFLQGGRCPNQVPQRQERSDHRTGASAEWEGNVGAENSDGEDRCHAAVGTGLNGRQSSPFSLARYSGEGKIAAAPRYLPTSILIVCLSGATAAVSD